MSAKTPEEVVTLFQKAMNAGDAAAVVKLYEPTATLVPPGGEPATGREAIAAAIKPFHDAKAELKLNVVRTVMCGDIAVLYDDWTATMDGPDGKRVPLEGKATEVVRKQSDGSWLFVFDDAVARG